jgi:hypothetical protein
MVEGLERMEVVERRGEAVVGVGEGKRGVVYQEKRVGQGKSGIWRWRSRRWHVLDDHAHNVSGSQLAPACLRHSRISQSSL